MVRLVRSIFKVALFIGLFLLSVRYVHTYPMPMPESQLAFWFAASDWFGIRDPDDLYIPTMVVIELIVTILAYVAIMKLWRRYHLCPR
ncbi:hypothetical protein GXB81_13555 [Paraburkholderia sp. Ac-20336]|uniref:hypothetical protein n=1 Tax=Paraburkholderia sp. Ac-20336 TaxID=2703886 RepID=UPI0019808870|nr:hypothetical protein [Paraburkholderia sp. Ac-20336]MBN3804069.1 hypothetical protein [Paraburkholderia sp. Ac-20336]